MALAIALVAGLAIAFEPYLGLPLNPAPSTPHTQNSTP